MTDKLDTIDEYTACMQTIAKDIRTTLTPDAAQTIEMWVNAGMQTDRVNISAISAFMDTAHMMKQYLDVYQLRQSALNKERIENLEAKIEELTGEVTYAN